VDALLAEPGDRRSCWQLAEAAAHATRRRLQALLAEHAWAWDAGLGTAQRFILGHLGDPGAVCLATTPMAATACARFWPWRHTAGLAELVPVDACRHTVITRSRRKLGVRGGASWRRASRPSLLNFMIADIRSSPTASASRRRSGS
jgi:hypothetical protein